MAVNTVLRDGLCRLIQLDAAYQSKTRELNEAKEELAGPTEKWRVPEPKMPDGYGRMDLTKKEILQKYNEKKHGQIIAMVIAIFMFILLEIVAYFGYAGNPEKNGGQSASGIFIAFVVIGVILLCFFAIWQRNELYAYGNDLMEQRKIFDKYKEEVKTYPQRVADAQANYAEFKKAINLKIENLEQTLSEIEKKQDTIYQQIGLNSYYRSSDALGGILRYVDMYGYQCLEGPNGAYKAYDEELDKNRREEKQAESRRLTALYTAQQIANLPTGDFYSPAGEIDCVNAGRCTHCVRRGRCKHERT